MSANIDMEEILELAFGISKASLKYKIGFDTETMGTVNFGNIPTANTMEANRMSWMGTPIMFPVKFDRGTYRVYDKNAELKEKEFNDFWLPPTTLVDFSRAHLVTKTYVVGNSGSVKEAKFFDDWRIRFRGVALDSRQSKAQDEIKKIIEWFNICQEIEVTGELFNQKNIASIVLTEIEIKSNVGNPSAVPFEITALSDKHILQEK